MPGIIQLLPDNIANQIAAGEVIQRPASAVKELLENAIDAGATKIKLVVKDAGRTLIQVIDNGCGMNETDARLCFERHATSKIKSADDLFNLFTKGFRGEALASIAAVSQVELKTKRAEDQLGVFIAVENSEVVKHESVSCADGSMLSMKNLFYNVPARRNFLKSDQVELKHIIEEFQRVVLVHPDIEFTFTHNGEQIFHLPSSVLRRRLVNFFGDSINEKLVPVDTDTNIVKVHGFVFKPEFCKRVRGDQFFFVNNRFIKSPALQHAVQSAYANILAPEHIAGFFLYLEVPPPSIDVNIHPTKTEVKFENEKEIYTILSAAVREALGKHNMVPSIDFNRENAVDFDVMPKDAEVRVPTIKVDTNYNPFKSNDGGFTIKREKIQTDEFMDQFSFINSLSDENTAQQTEMETSSASVPALKVFGKFLLAAFETKVLVIHIRRAIERVYFEQMQHHQQITSASQQLLFPEQLQLSPVKFALYSEIKDELTQNGFNVQYAGNNTVHLLGIPQVLGPEVNATQLVEKILDEADRSNNGMEINVLEIIQKQIAYNVSLQKSKTMNDSELQHLVTELMQTTLPTHTPGGLSIFYALNKEELEKRLD